MPLSFLKMGGHGSGHGQHGIDSPYKGYTIFQFSPATEDEVKTLQDLEEERNDGVIFLTRSIEAAIGKFTDVMVKPSLKEEFLQKLGERGLKPKVVGRICCCNDSKCPCMS